MEVLHNGFTLSICDGGFPLSTDSVALSGFVKLPKQAKVLDLGAGCGTLGLLLCANNADCQVTGIELDEAAHNCALENSRANGITSRLTSICADLRQVSEYIPAGSFHCCVSNPPYFSAGPKSLQTPSARRSDLCSTEDLFRSAAWALRYGGDFFLVHRPENLGQLCYWGTKYQLEPKKLCLLRHRPDGPVTLVLLHCRKGGKPGLVWQEECLQDADGQPSQYYKTLYHL
jgi:tRNA1(Val) A37 N6-methylase TrmN6